MAQILSEGEFANALRSFAGMPEDAVRGIMVDYEKAFTVASEVIGKVKKIGFFTGKMDRVEAFICTCRDMDALIAQKRTTLDHSVLAIFLLMFSSPDFHKSVKAFTNYAYAYRHQVGMTTDSKTADAFFRSGFQS